MELFSLNVKLMIYLSLVRSSSTSGTIDPLILSTCSMVSRSLNVHSPVMLLKLSPNNHEDGAGKHYYALDLGPVTNM